MTPYTLGVIMAKLTLETFTTLVNETSAVQTLNNNNAAIVAALENTLSRDGTVPNQMESSIDMNSNRLTNLLDAESGSEPVTKRQLDSAILGSASFTIPVVAAIKVSDYGSTDTAIQSAITAAQGAGHGVVIVDVDVVYNTASRIDLPSNTTIHVLKSITNNSTEDTAGIFNINAGSSNVTITGPGELIGPYASSTPVPTLFYPDCNGAISAKGLYNNLIENLKIEGLKIRGWGTYGVFLENCTGCMVYSHIQKCGRDGVRMYGCQYFNITHSRIHNIAPGLSGVSPNFNSYGVTFTRRSDEVVNPLVVNPPTRS
jgi:hypothetical protein